MQSVGSKDTGPELIVRRLLHSLGYRFRLHRADLPGKPDIVFSKQKKAIFVHGCFWHWHGCSKGKLPKTRLDYWEPKLGENVRRDKAAKAKLESLGWQVLVVWQCEINDLKALTSRLRDFLDS